MPDRPALATAGSQARVRSVRWMVVAVVSGMSALAIPLAVAVHAPTWVSAVLGLIAAAGQFVQGLSRDRAQSHLAHQEAVRLQKVSRDFHIDAGELSGQGLRERFKEFRQEFEQVKDDYGVEAFKVRVRIRPRSAGAPADPAVSADRSVRIRLMTWSHQFELAVA